MSSSSKAKKPSSPSPNSPQGPAQLRAAGRRPSMLPSPVRSRPSGIVSSRQLSAGFVPGGPLTSHPTTAYSAAMASGSRGSFERSTHTTALPPVSPHKNNKKRRSLVPVPTTPTTTAPAESSLLSRIKAENIPPSGSVASLAGRHRDSLQLRSTNSVPRRISPCPTERDSVADESLQLRRVQRVRSPVPFNLQKNSDADLLQPRPVPRVPSPAPYNPQKDLNADESLQLRRVQRNPSPLPQLPTQIPRPTPKSSDKKAPGIPKSRTFNFSTLTSSLSLSSFGRHDSRRPAASNMEDQTTPTRSGTNTSSGTMPAQATSPSLGYDPNDPRLIHTAQPSAYWSGRYASLRDKFMNEMLQPSNLQTILNADAERNKASAATKSSTATSHAEAGLTTSSTMSFLPERPSQTNTSSSIKAAENLTDEDKRDRRVFAHLEGLCTTDEARASLYEFQEAFARRHKKEWLLPRGGTMDPKGKGKGWVGRMFSGDKKKSGSGGSGQ